MRLQSPYYKGLRKFEGEEVARVVLDKIKKNRKTSKHCHKNQEKASILNPKCLGRHNFLPSRSESKKRPGTLEERPMVITIYPIQSVGKESSRTLLYILCSQEVRNLLCKLTPHFATNFTYLIRCQCSKMGCQCSN